MVCVFVEGGRGEFWGHLLLGWQPGTQCGGETRGWCVYCVYGKRTLRGETCGATYCLVGNQAHEVERR